MRIGFTEGTLFLNWYRQKKGLVSGRFYGLINFLFSTSGYYDKEITPNNVLFSLDVYKCENVYLSKTFDTYMKCINEGLKNCDIIEICCHPLPFEASNLNVGESLNVSQLHSLFENKKVLLMSCYATLMIEQVNSGNVKNIYPHFPQHCTFIPYDTVYTFFNDLFLNALLIY
jgi:hypothetical protein